MTSYSCFKKDNCIYDDDIYWMEWQAKHLAPRILMPAKNTKAVFNATISKLKKENPSITNTIMLPVSNRFSIIYSLIAPKRLFLC